MREQARLTTRRVAELSQKIAAAEANAEYTISHTRMVQIENGESTPSIYKLLSLSAIYGRSFNDLASLYVDFGAIARHQLASESGDTRLADFDVYKDRVPVPFPVRFDPGFSADKSNLISRIVETWGEVPAGILVQLKLREVRYGFIGLKDYTMYPLIRPGSFVQIEEQDIPAEPTQYRSEYERPIWFLELRDGYLCSWCDFKKERLVSVPHPLSPCHTREFAYPHEAELVGRVVAVAGRLVNNGASRKSLRFPTQASDSK